MAQLEHELRRDSEMKSHEITLFLHQAGAKPRVVQAVAEETLASALQRASLPADEQLFLFVGECENALLEPDEVEEGEDGHEPVDSSQVVGSLGSERTHHLHRHRCRRITTTINYHAATQNHRFSPATTIATVTTWARKKFK